MARIITMAMVRHAVEIIEPLVLDLLSRTDTTWGPRWGALAVRIPGLDEDPVFPIGTPIEWDPAWGEEKNFIAIAQFKLEAADRCGVSTRELMHIAPHLFEVGEYRYVGGVHELGISAAFSGAYGEVDEAIAAIFIKTLMMLVYLECRRRGDDARI